MRTSLQTLDGVNCAVWSSGRAPELRTIRQHRPFIGLDYQKEFDVPLRLIDRICVAGEGVNEDRADAAGAYAWVIDGATDVLDEPLTPASTDADWIAGTADDALHAYADRQTRTFAELPDHLTATLSDAFAAVSKRQPGARHEHPSAAIVVVKYEAGVLSFIAISDCTLLVTDPQTGETRRCGANDMDPGDRSLATAVAAHIGSAQAGTSSVTPDEVTPRDSATSNIDPPSILERMRPELQRRRDMLNREEGYGALSITPTPDIFIRTGFLTVEPGSHVLLATDGLMRLVDVFQRYDDAGIVAAAASDGLEPLLDELRRIETQEGNASAHPRVKASDDASALLLRVEA